MTADHPIRKNGKTYLLGWFILVSGLAHALFIVTSRDKPQQSVPIAISAPLQVTVVSTRSETKQQQPPASIQHNRPAEESQSSNYLIAKNRVSTANKKAPSSSSASTGITARPAVSVKPATVPLAINSLANNEITNAAETEMQDRHDQADKEKDNQLTEQAALNYLRQTLQQAIKARFTYPRMARRMGWQGKVGISLHIENDGSLKRVQINRSSGHKVLDENARKTIENIGKIKVASRYSMQATDTEIDVLYRLTD